MTKSTWRRAPLPTTSGLGSDRSHFLPLDDALRLIASVRQLNQHHGLLLNAHVTLHYQSAGITDAKQAAGLLSRFNQAAGRWVATLAADYVHPEWRHAYVYVHENARDRGLHTHELCTLPDYGRLHLQFRPWAHKWLMRTTGISEAAAKEALDVRVRGASQRELAIKRQWTWVAYLLKSIEPIYTRQAGRRWSITEVFGLPRQFSQPSWPVACAQRSGASHNIGYAAFARYGGLRRPDNLNEVGRGWDLEAHEQIKEEARLAPYLALDFSCLDTPH